MPCRSITSRIVRGKKLTWMSYKQYCDAHGKDEADVFIQGGSVMVRCHPKNDKIFQFCEEEEYLSMDFEKKKELKADQTKALNSKEFKRLQAAISRSKVSDMCIENDFSEGDIDKDDDDDADSASQLPKDLLALMGTKGKKEKIPSPANQEEQKKKLEAKEAESQKRLETLSSVAGDSKDTIMKKANKMHSLLLGIASKSDQIHKKDIQRMAGTLSRLIMEDSSKGMKQVLFSSVSIYKKAIGNDKKSAVGVIKSNIK